MILGLDVSTSITGATLLDENGEIVFCEAWDMRDKKRFKDLFDKASGIRLWLLEIALRHKVKKIYIEEPFMFFNSGGSSAKTMSTLQTFNGMVSWAAFRMLGVKPEYFKATAARKICGIKVSRGEKAKEKVLKFILDNIPDFEVEYTKFNNPKPGVYDRADSWVIAKSGLITWKEKNSES
jgi:Holliday junction resolvasome RuvABC endonuclease subunit